VGQCDFFSTFLTEGSKDFRWPLLPINETDTVMPTGWDLGAQKKLPIRIDGGHAYDRYRVNTSRFFENTVSMENFIKELRIERGDIAFFLARLISGGCDLSRIKVKQRSNARFSAPLRRCTRLPSSPNVMSGCQCRWFSIPQWLRRPPT
jgi:hypothetical protein